MYFIRKTGLALVVAALSCCTMAQAETKRPRAAKPPAASQPAVKPTTQSAIPEKIIREITKLADRERGKGTKSKTELVKLLKERMSEALELGQKTAKLYPSASNLPAIQLEMLRAAHFLAVVGNDPKSRKLTLKIAEAILASKATAKQKFAADIIKFSFRLYPDNPVSPKDAHNLIVAFADKYKGTDLEPVALAYAHRYAEQFNLVIAGKYADELRTKHGEHPFVKPHLTHMGVRPSPIGKPFKAALTTLDGKQLNLPGDLRGKIVVIDFWATWCVPCLKEIPRMQRLYAAYKNKGVQFVGISLDSNRGALTSFLKKTSLPWLHAFSGRQYDDPTVVRYQINSIPSVWLIDRKGNVITDNAYGRLAELLDKAVKAKPTTKPTTKPTAKPVATSAK